MVDEVIIRAIETQPNTGRYHSQVHNTMADSAAAILPVGAGYGRLIFRIRHH
jgi:hypothetical protein